MTESLLPRSIAMSSTGMKITRAALTDDGASCRVLGVDRTSGDILWNTEVHRQIPGPKRAQNYYATPTPVSDRVLPSTESDWSFRAPDQAVQRSPAE